MRISEEQGNLLAQTMFLEKLGVALERDVRNFSLLDRDDRDAFLVASLRAAQEKGIKTQQGIASYALAAWWLGMVFPEKSRYLPQLLSSFYPEVRKIYAMNEWVHTILGKPADLTGADEALRKAFFRTQHWGQGTGAVSGERT